MIAPRDSQCILYYQDQVFGKLLGELFSQLNNNINLFNLFDTNRKGAASQHVALSSPAPLLFCLQNLCVSVKAYFPSLNCINLNAYWVQAYQEVRGRVCDGELNTLYQFVIIRQHSSGKMGQK